MHFADKLKELSAADIFKWWQNSLVDKTDCFYTHRHYISDYEYIPWADDINTFVHREIDKPIIFIDPKPSVGYEILPNKYFFIYSPPPAAQDVIAEFWNLEAKAVDILKQIEGNNNATV